MNIAQIAENIEKLVINFNKDNFIFDLLLAYGTPKATIARIQQSDKNLFADNEVIVIKKKVYFQAAPSDLIQSTLNDAKTNEKVSQQAPRFIIVTDYETLLAYDTKTDESLDIPLTDISQHYDFFLPWAGMEKAQHALENPADVKAAERMAKLYDEIRKENPANTKEVVHNLNVFLSRLLFCFFAEDTGIFDKSLFTHSIDSHTQTDGSDVNTYLDKLFEVLNTNPKERNNAIPVYLNTFPYVNGGLFRNPHASPVFTRRSRQMLIDSGSLQWQNINPDIFGSMIQAVITPEHRGGLGMHYTSVPNIMKVIEPLFLDELKTEFENAKGNKKKLNDLLKRIWKIKIFDPACGSGNFLIIAYKELRKLEMQIFKALGVFAFSEISLGNFYGIELDDFAHEVATLSLWLAEHQMNQIFRNEFGDAKPALPLKESGNIVHGNACRINWESVCPKTINGGTEPAEVYILGNPPYLGARNQSENQKEDMKLAIGNIEGINNLDYISIWFIKASIYVTNSFYNAAFVTTNSICQGTQVPTLWDNIFKNDNEISFAYKSFKWSNNAKDNAGVVVTIIGIRKKNKKIKIFYHDNLKHITENISPYLVKGNTVIVNNRNIPLSNIPKMTFGSMPNDDGNLILDEKDKIILLKENPESVKFIKRFLGSSEFIRGNERWCLWINNLNYDSALSIPTIKNRIQNVKAYRENSKRVATNKLAGIPFRFGEIRHINSQSLIIPSVSSERREYIPIGFLDDNTIISNLALAIYDVKPWVFALLTSKIHMIWVFSIGGYLGTSIRYSISVCYNTFPFPPITDKQKNELEQHVYNILGEREKHSAKTLAELYDPDKMPEGLREAHRQNDLAVERCYRSKPFESDEERLEYLFKLYEQMIEEEKERGTLFERGKKKKP